MKDLYDDYWVEKIQGTESAQTGKASFSQGLDTLWGQKSSLQAHHLVSNNGLHHDFGDQR